MREIDEWSFISKTIPDRAGSCEKEIPAVIRSCELEKQVLSMAKMMIKLAHDLRDETLRVSKEHEDEFLNSLPRQQSLPGHTWMM